MVHLRAALIGLAGSVALAAEARAEPSATILLAGSCTPAGASAAEILRILDAEMSPLHVAPFTTSGAARGAEAVLGLEACVDEPASAKISVFRGAERRDRVVALADAAPDARARVLALAFAEALRDPATTQASDEPPPWVAPAAVVAPVAAEPPHDERVSGAPRREIGIAPRAALLFRYAPASATPVLGAGAGIDWGRANAGIRVLATRQSDPLGSATLFAIAASTAFDVVELLRDVSLRVEGELGAAVGTGSPARAAIGRTQAALHAGLFGGVAGTLPVGAGYELQAFVAGGYATSLDAGADGRRVATLGGPLLGLELAVRFP